MPPAVNVGEPEDWYALLGLSPTSTTEQIAVVVDRLVTLAEAESATASERSRDLYLQIAAIRADLLSGPDRRRRYDEMLAHREWAAATRPRRPTDAVPPLPISAPESPQTGQAYPVPTQAPEPWVLAPEPVAARRSEAETEIQPANGGHAWVDPQAGNGPVAGIEPSRAVPPSADAVWGEPADPGVSAQPGGTGSRPAGPAFRLRDPADVGHTVTAGAGFQAGNGGSAPGRPNFAGAGTEAGRQAAPTGHQEAAGSRAGRTMARLTHFLRTAWTCPTCGHGALPADKFCQKCGARVSPPRWSGAEGVPHRRSPISPPVLCIGCGNRITAGNMYCTQCGTRRP
ncbi:MAG: zinc ribbon domain-containing protein [Streptosporangiaceae bacterium]